MTNYFYGRVSNDEDLHEEQQDRLLNTAKSLNVSDANTYIDIRDEESTQLYLLIASLEKGDHLFTRDMTSFGDDKFEAQKKVCDIMSKGVDVTFTRIEATKKYKPMTTDHITLKSGFYKQISQAFEVFEEGNVAFRQVAQEKSKSQHAEGIQRAIRSGKLSNRRHWRDPKWNRTGRFETIEDFYQEVDQLTKQGMKQKDIAAEMKINVDT